MQTVGFAQLDAGDSRDGIPLICWLDRAAQQYLFRHRLPRHSRIDAG